MTQQPQPAKPLPFQALPRTRRKWLPGVICGGVVLIFLLNLACWLMAESLWFEEMGYQEVFWLRWLTRLSCWAIALVVSACFMGGNFHLAHRRSKRWGPDESHNPLRLPRLTGGAAARRSSKGPPFSQNSPSPKSSPSPRTFEAGVGAMGLRRLMATSIGLALLLSLLLYHYGWELFQTWQQGLPLLQQNAPSLIQFNFYSLGQDLVRLFQQPWQCLSLLASVVLLVVAPWTTLMLEALLLSVGFGLVASSEWMRILPFFQPTNFGIADAQFGRDLSFYIFTLPVLELLRFWGVGLLLFTLVAVAMLYILGDGSLSRGRFRGFSSQQQHHLCGLAGGFMATVALSHWLSRYGRLYSQRGSLFGASYTDVRVQLPVDLALTAIASVIAVVLLLRAGGWTLQSKRFRSFKLHPLEPHHRSKLLAFVVAHPVLNLGIGYLLLVLFIGNALPRVVQQLVVLPNELERERSYISRSIAATRQGFGLEDIEVQTFDPGDNLTLEDLQTNRATLDNVRLWDTRPLLLANRQLQQIRLYYSFPDADIDRYSLQSEEEGGIQQVIVAARELDYDSVPDAAKTWVNEHLVYTHGYGFTLSPVNTVGGGGLPNYFVKDIGTNITLQGSDALGITEQEVRANIPIGSPRIYYGGLTNTYVMTSTRNKELDYPSGNNNAENVYGGSGGIGIGNLWRRWTFAAYLRDWQMGLTRNFTPDTKLLFRRNIQDRIQTLAPFLQFDQDPYLVIAEPEADGISPSNPSKLYWMVDAYTTSDRYPYSEPGDHPFNYIRNSVKVIIDAYNGSVQFYIADPEDPIIQSWSRLFPNLLQPLAAMPDSLREHIRYPVDLFDVQSERLLTYHMTDAKLFYNREDQWQVPREIYANESQEVEPYYLTMRLPTADQEEFVLLHPFTPVRRNNLIAWLAGRSDGENYGKLLLYQFPKQRLVYGPEQIEARINQDPQISQLISLWNRQGSRVIQGNLLVIPIEQSLLYVEPLYLEAERNSIPTLIRVVVAYGNRIVMEENLEQGLALLFGAGNEVEQESDPEVAAITSPTILPQDNLEGSELSGNRPSSIPQLPSAQVNLNRPITSEIGDPSDPNLSLPVPAATSP